MKGKIGVNCAYVDDKVILECLNRSLSGVAPVDTHGYELEVYVLFLHAIF